MGNLPGKLIKASLFLFLLLAFVDSNAQKTYEPIAINDIRYTIENDVLVSPTELQFDLYLLDTDAAQSFELAIIQAGIIVSNTIFNSGTLTPSIVSGYSDLVASEQPTTCQWATGTYGGIIKMTPRTGPGCGFGTTISTTGLGSRVARIKLVNTASFTACSHANLTFNFTTSPYPTKVFIYSGSPCVSSQVTTDATNTHTGTTYQNLSLNCSAPPTPFNVTGTGSYCAGTGGLAVGLAGSELGVTYTLYKDLVAQVPTVAGTGSAITFGNQLGTHTYTVKGTNPGGTTDMTGSAIITENPTVVPTISIVASQNPTTTGTSITFTSNNSGTGGSTPSYQWYLGVNPVGPNNAQYTYSPDNNDQIKVIMTSNAACASPTTATSNIITMAVYDNIWTGATSSEWDNATNWNPQSLPFASSSILIPVVTNLPVVTNSNGGTCRHMTVASGATVTINSTSWLSVTGTSTLNAPEALIIHSDASGTGSFIDNGFAGAGTAKVDRYLTGYTDPHDLKYHFLSSPVTSYAIQGNFVNLPNSTDDFYKWDEITNTWINTRATGGGWNASFEPNFIPGRGYLIAYPGASTKHFIGTLNTGTSPFTINCTYTSTAAGGGGGWNLIGNPFPSAIDWNAVMNNANGLYNMDNALYYYNSEAANYKYYVYLPGIPGNNSYLGTGTKNIPAMQGVMVHVNNQYGEGSVTFTNTMRIHEGMDLYNKSACESLSNYLVLKAEGASYSDEAFVYFTGDATSNFDGRLDAYKLMSMESSVPMIYTVTPDQTKLAINCLPPSTTNLALPVGFIAGVDGPYTITASELSTFPANTMISLEDLKSGTSQNLMQNPVYIFQGVTGDDHNRFVLHFGGSIGINDQKDPNAIKIYPVNNTVYISCAAGLHGKITITDLLGQELLSRKLNDKVLDQVQLTVTEGYYIVKVNTDQTVRTVKIFLK